MRARLLLALLTALAAAPCLAAERTAVVLLFDGFAPSLLERAPTPALDRIRAEGAWSHDLVPAFPTISVINAVTVSTGCWPEHHGVVTNDFLDPQRGRYDHSGDADWLSGCEHLHQAAERQGLASAAIGWVGARSETRGELATWVADESELGCGDTLEESARLDGARADRIVELLGRGAGGPRLVLGYFCGPDGAEHFTGMDSAETAANVARSDAIVARILAAIEARPDRDDVALLITTDHGMLRVSHLVNIRRILASHGIEARAVSTGTTSFLYFDDPGRVDAAARALSRYEEFDVLRRGQLPDYAHLGAGPRVGDLIVSAKPPYFIEDPEAWPGWARWLARVGPEFVWARFGLKASHGYPPDTEGMEGILYAWGAGIAHRQVPRVPNIDIHPTVAHLLGIGPGRPVDGSLAAALLR